MHSKPQKEQWLYKQLTAREIEAYYPCLHTRNDKFYSCTAKPYFPGYLFVNVDLEATGISLLQWLPGSLGLVCFGGEPACVPEGLLYSVRRHVEEINRSQGQIFENLRPGDEIVIHSGPFAGYDAIFCTRLRDSERVQVLLKVLQNQGIKIDLQVNQVRVKKQNRNLQ
jgi:transcriptional antiterminator RfaH